MAARLGLSPRRSQSASQSRGEVWPRPAVAARARADLVLRPRRPALEARDHVLERKVGMAGLEWAPAPDALAAVPGEDAPRPLGAWDIGSDRIGAVHTRMVPQTLRLHLPATKRPLVTARAGGTDRQVR